MFVLYIVRVAHVTPAADIGRWLMCVLKQGCLTCLICWIGVRCLGLEHSVYWGYTIELKCSVFIIIRISKKLGQDSRTLKKSTVHLTTWYKCMCSLIIFISLHWWQEELKIHFLDVDYRSKLVCLAVTFNSSIVSS